MKCTTPVIEITKPKQILVEGRDDQEFVRGLLKHQGINDVEVQAYLGKDRLKTFLPGFCNLPDFRNLVTSLAVLRDADFDPAQSAFVSVCNSLRGCLLKPPEELATFSDGHPRIGVFVIPDCYQDGMIETLCFQAVLHRWPKVEKEVERFFLGMSEIGIAPLSKEQIPKARLRAFLATQPLKDALIGHASRAQVWDWNAPVLLPLRTFLEKI